MRGWHHAGAPQGRSRDQTRLARPGEGWLPAILRFGSLSPQAERCSPSAHANVGPAGIAPGINHLLLTQARSA